MRKDRNFPYVSIWVLLVLWRWRPTLVPPVSSLSSPDTAQNSAVSIVSWNLLAPIYASRTKYPWSEPNDLDWNPRKRRIVSRLAEIDADIVCLQEVQVDLWDDLLDDLSNRLDYHRSALQKMGRNHPVANAILVKRGCPLQIVRTESRSRVLIAVLQDTRGLPSAESPAPLYLANVHLEAGMEEEDIRLAQLRSLCKRLRRQTGVDSKRPAIVFCGDFNLIRDSPLYTFLQTGSYVKRDNDEFIHSEIHSPLLPLRDAYLELSPLIGDVPRMSFRSGHFLDYFWVSPAVDVLRTMPMGNAVATAEPKNWPSEDNPSDHVPIGALLWWSGAPMADTMGHRPTWQDLSYTNYSK